MWKALGDLLIPYSSHYNAIKPNLEVALTDFCADIRKHAVYYNAEAGRVVQYGTMMIQSIFGS